MNNLGGFLEKFKNLLGTSKFQKDAVISMIESVVKIKLQDKEIDIKDFVVYIKASPAVRGEIFMRKQKILDELKKVLANKAPREIR